MYVCMYVCVQHYVTLRPSAESSTGYLRMKSSSTPTAAQADSCYLPMTNSTHNDYLTPAGVGHDSSYLTPRQTQPRDANDDDDDDDDDAGKALKPAAAAENTADASLVNSTLQDSGADRPLLSPSHVKYSSLKQHDDQ